jgi:hypothetical protein
MRGDCSGPLQRPSHLYGGVVNKLWRVKILGVRTMPDVAWEEF